MTTICKLTGATAIPKSFFNRMLLAWTTCMLSFSSTLEAQTSCNCSSALQNLVSKIEAEYPGFPEKTAGNIEVYRAHKSLLLQKSNTAEEQHCAGILQQYISFFRDEHIFLQQVMGKETAVNTAAQNDEARKEPQKEEEVIAKTLRPGIFYIKMVSFQYQYVEPIRQLVQNHRKELEKCKGLIIDIRDNGGGTDDAYQPLLPFILSDPIRIMSVEFFATQTLINGLRDYALRNIKQDTLNERKKIEEGLEIYKENLGKFVLYGDSKVLIDSIKINKKSPAQIVVLANKNVASSGENFLFSVRQSKKVKIMGTPTMGALDYGSIREFPFGCDNYELYLPTYRSSRLPQYPIDNIGVQPDLYLDETAGDWIDFAVQYLSS